MAKQQHILVVDKQEKEEVEMLQLQVTTTSGGCRQSLHHRDKVGFTLNKLSIHHKILLLVTIITQITGLPCPVFFFSTYLSIIHVLEKIFVNNS